MNGMARQVFEKTQVFEEKRLNFLKAVLFRLHASLDLTKFKEYEGEGGFGWMEDGWRMDE